MNPFPTYSSQREQSKGLDFELFRTVLVMGDAGAAPVCTLLQNHGKGAEQKHQSTGDARGSSLYKAGSD